MVTSLRIWSFSGPSCSKRAELKHGFRTDSFDGAHAWYFLPHHHIDLSGAGVLGWLYTCRPGLLHGVGTYAGDMKLVNPGSGLLDISNNQEPRIGGYGCLVTMLVPMCVGPPGLGLRGLISAVFSEIRKDKSKAGHYM